MPDVHVRVQGPCHALDHHHRSLQQDQLGPGLHAEALGDLEEVGEQPRHRDPRGVHAEDRLADGAQGAGEFVDIAVGGHVAGLEMHLGDTLVVPTNESVENLRVDPSSVFVDVSHDAEIIRDDITIGRHLEVALVHVGVEKAVTQRMVQEKLQHPLAQLYAVVAGGIQRGIVAERLTLGPAHGHHPAAGQPPDHGRQLEALVALGVGSVFAGRGGFEPQVEFAHHDALEMRDHVAWAQPP